MSRAPAEANRNQDATCYIGNLDERATDALVWELMLQAGPVVNVHLPKDRISQAHQGYGFAEFQTEQDAEYACKIMNGIKLFGKPLRVNKASSDRKQIDIGANLFVGNLDQNVDERILYDAFMSFGTIVGLPKVRSARSVLSKTHLIDFLLFTDCSRSIERSVERIRIHLLRLVRSIRCSNRVDEQSISSEQASDSRLRAEEGCERRGTAWNSSGETGGRTGEEKQRHARTTAPASRLWRPTSARHASIRRNARDGSPAAASARVCSCSSRYGAASPTTAWVHASGLRSASRASAKWVSWTAACVHDWRKQRTTGWSCVVGHIVRATVSYPRHYAMVPLLLQIHDSGTASNDQVCDAQHRVWVRAVLRHCGWSCLQA